MKTMPEFPFPVEAPDDDDPFYGNPMFPNGMVIIDNKTGARMYAVVIHFDGEGRVRVWVCRARKFIVIKIDMQPIKGAKIMPIDAHAEFFCIDCKKPNDLHSSTTRCTKCVARGN